MFGRTEASCRNFLSLLQTRSPGLGFTATAGHAGVDQGVEHLAFVEAEPGHHRHVGGWVQRDSSSVVAVGPSENCFGVISELAS